MNSTSTAIFGSTLLETRGLSVGSMMPATISSWGTEALWQ